MSDLKRYEAFEEMPIHEMLLKGIYAYGFDTPSDIQKRGIGAMLTKRDCILQSQSGTGKTATFCISFLSLADPNIRSTQCLVISPTRELADQTYGVMKCLGEYMEGIKIHLSRGGTNPHEDAQKLSRGPQIVVATPGRFLDMNRKKAVSAETIKHICLDEADELLTLGFQDQIQEIIQAIDKEAQICLVSATMPSGAHRLSEKFMQNPIRMLVNEEELTLEGIDQFAVNVGNHVYKFDTLMDIYQRVSISQAIIYCNRKRDAESLAERLEKERFTVAFFHGELPNRQRSSIIKDFRSGSLRVLVATDVLARGIDVQQVSLVINYDIPKETETYIHRIGRSGRFGRKGVAINLTTNRDQQQLKVIENHYETRIKELPASIESIFSY